MAVRFDRIFFKFILAGILNTIVGSGLMFVMYNVFGMEYWISSATNYIAGSILSFFLNKYWTFNIRRWSLYIVIAFIAVIAVSYFLAYKIARTAVYFVLADQPEKLRDNAAMLAGMVLYVGLNYCGQRFLVFKPKKAIKFVL